MNLVGEGAYGKVFKGLKVASSEDVAIKIIHKKGLRKEELEAQAAEVEIT